MSQGSKVGPSSGLSKSIANKFAKQGKIIGLIARCRETIKPKKSNFKNVATHFINFTVNQIVFLHFN